MIAFLKVVAAFFLAIVAFVILVVVIIRWKLKKFLKNMMETVAEAATSAVPPFRISLQPMDDDDESPWNHEDDVQRLTNEFEAAGFTQIGDFDVEGLPLQLRGFQHQQHQIYGVIYDHAVVGCWSDAVRRYADESPWTVSSAKEHGMDPPPGHHPFFMPGETISNLVEKLLEVSPREGVQNAGADMFSQRLEAAYAREMNWRIERGGPTESEIRRIAANDGQECSANDVKQIQNLWRSAIAEFFSEEVLRAWRKESGIPKREYRRLSHRLIVIHERMLPEQLLDLVESGSDSDEDSVEDAADPASDHQDTKIVQWSNEQSPFIAFRRLLKERGAESGWEQLGAADKPVRAEIWKRPGDDDEDSDNEEPIEFDDELSL